VHPTDLSRIQEARVGMAFHHSQDPDKPVFLNGEALGRAPVTSSFAPRQFVPVPPAKLGLVRMDNTVEIGNPHQEGFCVGGVYLEINPSNGRPARTTVSPALYATSDQWDEWHCPVLQKVPPTESVRIEGLRFHT
jgi:hypothetical protein